MEESIEKTLGSENLKKLKWAIEDRIYNAGLYRKMSGSWSIEAELDEDATQDYIDEKEDDEPFALIFMITARQDNDDCGQSNWWTIKAILDDKMKLKEITEQ